MQLDRDKRSIFLESINEHVPAEEFSEMVLRKYAQELDSAFPSAKK